MRALPSFTLPMRFLRGSYSRLTLSIVALALGVALVCAIDLVNRAVLRAFVESKKDVAFWAVHGRSPQVLQAMAECLELDDTDLEAARRVWKRHGNMLSATVFFVLQQLEEMAAPKAGANGLMLAFGAGASCEMVLLRAPVAA